jgi:hypothetical protein
LELGSSESGQVSRESENYWLKKGKKSWSSVQIFDKPLQTIGKRVSGILAFNF